MNMNALNNIARNAMAMPVFAVLAVVSQFPSVAAFAGQPDPMPIQPAPDSVLMRNPPLFTWPMTKAGNYVLELATPAGNVVSYKTGRNWLTLPATLPAGNYRWRISGAGGYSQDWLNFTIAQDAMQFPIPDIASLYTRVTARQRPRTLDLTGVMASKYCRGTSWNWGVDATKKGRSDHNVPETDAPNTLKGGERVAAMKKLRQFAMGEEESLLTSTVCALISKNTSMIPAIKQRVLDLADLDPQGVTGFTSHDQTGRSITWTLALAYDWLFKEWTAQERSQILAALKYRLEDMLGSGPFGLKGSLHLDNNPFDSHGVTALARSAVICTILAGEEEFFDRCFKDVVPRYLAWPVSFGGDDGGFANGTTYAQWNLLTTQMLVWDLLKPALGVDLTQHPWARNHGAFMAYFLPPGSPSGVFGDDAEKKYANVWATQAKAYAARIPSPLADWFARNQIKENREHLAMLLAPAREFARIHSTLPVGTPNAIHIPSIGWTAMHSDLNDLGRTSVYFKSSTYGSFNHSHADQNSFVINAKGRQIAIDSGYFDYYNSPHWKDWYKQTRAHNAITFDGGQGQIHDVMAAKGKITQFEHSPHYDLVTGDAHEAYGIALTRAVRSLVYLRPGMIVVFDSLASDTPRKWEWNIHAMGPMKVKDARNIEIDQEGVRLCVRMLDGPNVEFNQTDSFTIDPQGDYPRQWHGTFSSRKKSREAVFVTMLEVGCEDTQVKVSQIGAQSRVQVGGHDLRFDGTVGVIIETH